QDPCGRTGEPPESNIGVPRPCIAHRRNCPCVGDPRPIETSPVSLCVADGGLMNPNLRRLTTSTRGLLTLGLVIREGLSSWTGHPYDMEVWLRNAYFVSRGANRSEEHTSELQSSDNLVCRLLLDKKKHN